MAEGAVAAGGIHFPITGDIEGLRQALQQAQTAARSSSQEIGKNLEQSSATGLSGFQKFVQGASSGIGSLVGRFNVFLQAFNGIKALFSSFGGQVTNFAEQTGTEEDLDRLTQAASELGASIKNSLVSALESGGSALGEFTVHLAGANQSTENWRDTLSRAVDRAVADMRRLQGAFEGLLITDPAARSINALRGNIEDLESAIRRIDAQIASREEGGSWLTRLFGDFAGNTIAQLRRAREEAERELGRLRELLAARTDIPDFVTSTSVDSVEQMIDALKRQNQELAIRTATFRMAAGAAAEYAANQRLAQAAGDLMGAVSPEQMARVREQIRLHATLTQTVDDQRKAMEAQRRAEQEQRSFDRDIAASEREIALLGIRAQALALNAGEVARLTMEERLLAQAKMQGRQLSEAELTIIRATATAFGQATEQANRLQEGLRGIQEVGRTVASSLERAFDKFITEGKVKFSDFVKSLQADLAKLAFRQAMMGLFGGGQNANNPLGVLGSGLLSIFSGGFGGFRAEGGPVASNTAYVVGEKGPELFVPRGAGTVMPNSSMGGGPSTINMRIDLAGANGDDTIVRISRQAAAQAAQQAIEASNAAFPARQRRLHYLGT